MIHGLIAVVCAAMVGVILEMGFGYSMTPFEIILIVLVVSNMIDLTDIKKSMRIMIAEDERRR